MPETTTVGQRFIQLIQQLGLTKNAFALSLGKTATVIQHLVEERNKPGYELLCKVFEVYPNVSKDWLLLGQGPMLLAPVTPAPATRAAASAAILADEDGIDLAALAGPARRRNGQHLHPADVAATLVLAAQHQNGHGNGPATTAPPPAAEAKPDLVAAPVPAAPAAPPPAAANTVPAATAPAVPVAPPALSVPVVAAPPAPALPDPAYLAALFQTQQLQHQLALAEQRNQHLLEQQELLKQMLVLLQNR